MLKNASVESSPKHLENASLLPRHAVVAVGVVGVSVVAAVAGVVVVDVVAGDVALVLGW
jgi:hypothetical protein